jgi:2-keto-4-pentenoate hydratase/2-oxohepta-3-ene-1,7-dioic acid hydratase in catechol pathway
LKIARYLYRNEENYGVIHQQTILPLPALAKRFKKKLAQKIEDFIVHGENTLRIAENLLQNVKDYDIRSVSMRLNDVSLVAPIAFPPKIICLGRNYVDHSDEMKEPPALEPVIFIKPHTTIIGPNEKIIKPSFVKGLDYEGELAIIIGKKAKNVTIAQAESCIFGYTVFNDVSARDFQFRDVQWTRGKSFDTFAPIGPSITTRAQLPNTSNLSLKTWVNGELRQNATTRNMILNTSEIVHHLSRVMTLEPCDVIATGTPAGVGFAMKPPRYLIDGDVVRIEIEGIGVLENTVKEECLTV